MRPSSVYGHVDTIVRDFVFSLRELDTTLLDGLYLTGSVSLNEPFWRETSEGCLVSR